MTQEPKLLTEAEALAIWDEAQDGHPGTFVKALRERGLIAPEPVDPLLVEARELGSAGTLAEAEAEAVVHLQHKDTLLIHEEHAGTERQVVHAYRVRKGAAKYIRNPVSGLSERVEPMTLDKLFSLPVIAFEPKRAFDALLDDPVGVDRALLTGKPEQVTG